MAEQTSSELPSASDLFEIICTTNHAKILKGLRVVGEPVGDTLAAGAHGPLERHARVANWLRDPALYRLARLDHISAGKFDLLRMGELCRKLPVHQGNWVDHEITHARIEELLFGVPGKSIRPALYDPLQGKDWMEPMGHGHAFNLKLVLK